MAKDKTIYPTFSVVHIKDPNRFYAFPVLGFVVKAIMLIPVAIELFFLEIAYFFLTIINSLVVVFTGKYWDTFYSFNLGLMRLTTKVHLFLLGLTNKYPGFDFAVAGGMSLDIAMPQNPSRVFAIPLIGGLIRFILLIPYLIYVSVVQYGAWVGAVISSFPVLFSGKYPESAYEFGRDMLRVTNASMSYFSGLSDSYPSFSISMNHKNIKIALIVVGALLFLYYMANSITSNNRRDFRYERSQPYVNGPSGSILPSEK